MNPSPAGTIPTSVPHPGTKAHLHETLHAALQGHSNQLHARTTLLRQQLLVLHLQRQLVVHCKALCSVTAGAHDASQIAV